MHLGDIKNKQLTKKNMKISKFTKVLLGAALVLGAITQAQAQDKKADPTGTYIWTQPGRNGGADRTNTLVLKLAGDKLTGSVTAPGRGGAAAAATEISDGKVTSTNITFNVVRDFNGNTMTTKYTGVLADGTIKGTADTDRNGTP